MHSWLHNEYKKRNIRCPLGSGYPNVGSQQCRICKYFFDPHMGFKQMKQIHCLENDINYLEVDLLDLVKIVDYEKNNATNS